MPQNRLEIAGEVYKHSVLVAMCPSSSRSCSINLKVQVVLCVNVGDSSDLEWGGCDVDCCRTNENTQSTVLMNKLHKTLVFVTGRE